MLLRIIRSPELLDCQGSESRTAIAPGLPSFWVTLLGHLHLTTEPLAFSLEPSRSRLLEGKGGGILLEQSTEGSVQSLSWTPEELYFTVFSSVSKALASPFPPRAPSIITLMEQQAF